MTNFELLKNFINSYSLNDFVYRSHLMKKLECNAADTTIDNYRNWLTKAGYLNWIHSGKYQLVKYISENMTSRKLRKEAYPDTWKFWYENRNKL